MASSSSSHQQNQDFNAFSGIEPAGKSRRKVSESSRLFDVYINHRGPDVKQTLATQLYNSLAQLGIRAFLDSEDKELGNSFPSTIETVICSVSVHIAIFSKRYAESAWCLAEVVLMLQSNATIIPVFYEVEPWELRHIERGRYAEAFIKYEEKGRYLDKLSEWKEALQSLSFSAGEVFNSDSDCQKIVVAVQKEVQGKTCLHVADYPVGLNNDMEDFERRYLIELIQDFENHCGLEEGKHKGKVVGIFGMGGSGKTTLVKELFNLKFLNFKRASFLFDVGEASARSQLPSLQLRLLKDLFLHNCLSFTSIEEGRSRLKDCLRRSPLSSFLIVVDHVDHVEQLDALLVMDILNKFSNSLAIVTTHDVGVLIKAGIHVGYNLKGMDRNYGRELFCWHAFGQPHPKTGYEELVNSFVELCGGLPLSLQVLGRHVHCRSKNYWRLELIKVSKILPRDVKQRLKISFDALDSEEKKVFMDIACFFIGKPKSIAKMVWEGSGWNAQHALMILKDKCLVQEIDIVLRMHDYLRDLGRELALELSPPHRLWRPLDLRSLELMGFKAILTTTDIRCFHSIFDESMGSKVSFFLGQSNDHFETGSLLWLQLEGNSTTQPNIPSWIPLQNLQFLKIEGGRLKTLWKSRMQVPSQLKELQISKTSLEEFPDLLGISKDSLESGESSISVKEEFSDLLGISKENLKSGEKSSSVKEEFPNLLGISKDSLEIGGKSSSVKEEFPNVLGISKDSLESWGKSSIVKAPMSSLEKLKIDGENFVSKILISGIHYPSLNSIKLHGMENLMEVNLTRVNTLNSLHIRNCQKLKRFTGASDLTNLVLLRISECPDLEFEDLCLRGMNCLKMIAFDRNVKVKYFELDGCQNLKTLKFGCEELVELVIRGCPELKELPIFLGPSCLERIIIDGCGNFGRLQLHGCQNLRDVSGNFELTELYIYECPELEELPSLDRMSCLKKIEIVSCEMLQTITLPTTINSLSVRSCRDLQRVAGTDDLMELVEFEISDCGKLEFENLWEDKDHAPLQLKELIITGTWSASFDRFPSSISYLNRLKKIALLGDVVKDFGIKGLPEEFCDLQSLEHLELRHCTLLSSLPARFGDLRNLRHLDLCSCKALTMLPVSFQQLTHLNYLDLSGCKRLVLQKGILENITQLENMYLSGCLALQELPHQITDQACMKELRLQHTSLEDLPSNIGQLGKLQVLTIGSPLLKSLPDSFGNLSSLKSLSIIDCFALESLPRTLGHLELLEHLCIEATGVRSLPEGFRQLANLRTLKISDCPLSELDFVSVSSFSLEKLTEINLSETLVTRISISEHCCPRLETLRLSKNDYLEEIETLPATVNNIELSECETLKNIKGIHALPIRPKLAISDCPEELEKPSEF